MNAYGRTFHRGKSFEKDMRSLTIDDILSGGGDVSTEYYPGSFRAIGSEYKVSSVTVSNGRPFVKREKISLDILRLGVNRKKRLEEPELDIEAHSTTTASMAVVSETAYLKGK